MKVLYVSHTALVSGGERSLLDTRAALPDGVDAVLASPPGPLTERWLGRVVELPAVDATLGGGALEGVRSVRRAARALGNVVRRESPDIVHANSIRAGLVACSASLATPVVVSVRDRLPAGLRSAAARRLIRRRASLVLANSCHTLEAFGPSRHGDVLYPGVAQPALPLRADARAALALDPAATVLGVVAQITPWKGQDDAIRILAGVSNRHPDAVLLLAGSAMFESATHDNAAYERGLHVLAAELGVADRVRFLGDRADIPLILRALDILLVPSWDEPFGRTAVEALAAGVPVAATSVGGPAETLAGTDGLLLPPRSPEAWVGPVCDLLSSGGDPDGRRLAAAAFTPERHVEQLLEHYGSLRSAA
jgi:glycosyltransferase involved in cell wall biosynthesis